MKLKSGPVTQRREVQVPPVVKANAPELTESPEMVASNDSST